jgi:pre-mRNA-splicing factor 18
MDLLKAEIERKRKATEALKSSIHEEEEDNASSSKAQPHKVSRFIRQTDVMQQKQRELELKAKEMEEREAELRRQRERQEFSAREKASSTINASATEPAEAQSHHAILNLQDLNIREIYHRLRVLSQPITLFGESSSQRLARLETALLKKAEHDDKFALRHIDSSAADDDDDDAEEDEAEDDAQHSDSEDDGIVSKHTAHAKRKAHDPNEPVLFSKIPDYPKEKVVYKYLKHVLKMWEMDLEARDERSKASAKGKMDTKTYKQCKDYLRPLLKMCKRRQMDSPDILLHLVEIVRLCEEGNFRAAHEEYLRTAIGNAAWPIGLTMVGIHERSGRERISTAKIAHVMNNEQQRKYLTSVRRLMTYAQTKRPDIPPSMKVL